MEGCVNMGIGKRIREAREAKGLTQKQLADMLGVTASAVTNYENETSHPKEPILYRLLNCLDVDANYLFHDVMVTVADSTLQLSASEMALIKKYRALDERGKESVDELMEKQILMLQLFKLIPPENRVLVLELIEAELKNQGLR
jgi:transcriptional regulator with XRE-family HTH domain